MPDVDPALPVSYAWWVPVLGFLLLAAAIAWVVFVLWRPRTPRPAGPEDAGRLRASFGEQLEGAYGAFRRGEITLRDLHLQVAGIIRSFGSRRVGRDLTALSRREAQAYLPGSGLGELLERCEEPSFARDPAAEAEQTMGLAREVMARW